MASQFVCKLERFRIAGVDGIKFAMFSINPNRPDSMNNILRRKIECWRIYCASNGNRTDLLALGKQLTGSSGQIDRTVYRTGIYRIRVCRIDDRVCCYLCYIIADNLKRHDRPPLARVPHHFTTIQNLLKEACL